MLKSLTNNDLDDIDKQLLGIIQKDGDLSNVEISRKINLSPPATHTRMKRLEERGFIKKYATLLDREKLGYDLLCFIYIKMSSHRLEHLETFESAILNIPEILECHHVTGNYDYVLKVVLKNTEDLKNFIKYKISTFANISGIETSLSYDEIKSTTVIPIK